jgi:hypothetical protein
LLRGKLCPKIIHGRTRIQRIIYQVVKEKVDLAFQDIEHVETKAGILIAFNGVIISLALKDIYDHTCFPLLIVSLTFFLVALGLNFMTFRAKKYRRDPNPRRFTDAYWNTSRKEIMEQVTANLIECYEYNEGLISNSASWINYSMVLTAFGLVFLIVSVWKN